MSDTRMYIADTARARNDARRTITAPDDFDAEANSIGSNDSVAAIGAALRNGAPPPTTGYFTSGRRHVGEATRPLNSYSEHDILDLIRDAIGPHYPIGSASRWHKQAAGLAEKRIAEAIAGIVHGACGDDPLARRVAIAAAGHAAALPPTPLRALIRAAIDAAVAAIDGKITEVACRLAAIRARRTRAALAELSARRNAALARAREFEREAAAIRRDIAGDRRVFTGDPRFERAWRELEERDLPKLARQAAASRAEAPSYRLTSGQRRRLVEFGDRLRRLRAARRALRRALRDLDRAKVGPMPAKAEITAA